MNNPFRHRFQDDRSHPRRDWDDDRYQARDTRFDEGRSWRDDNRSDRQSDYEPRYGEGRYEQGEQGYRAQGGDISPGQGRWAGQFGGGRRWEADYSHARGYGRNYGRAERGYQAEHDYGRYPQHAYAPGSQIWDAPSARDDYYGAQGWNTPGDFEPDYLHWRQEQMRSFDRDYHDWRNERRQKFSTDFHSWRQSRPQEAHHESANPIVGDVADGGDGRKGRDKL